MPKNHNKPAVCYDCRHFERCKIYGAKPGNVPCYMFSEKGKIGCFWTAILGIVVLVLLLALIEVF